MLNIVDKALSQDISQVNVDWFGTMLVAGLLDYSRFDRAQEIHLFAKRWLVHHLRHQPELSDEEYARENGGAEGRVIRGYRIPIATYAGYFGLSFAAAKLYDIASVDEARQLCVDVADCILHHCARNTQGLVMHDDRPAGFTIPDVCYFVAPPLLQGARFSAAQGASFRRQGEIQLKGFVDTFLDPELHIARTILRNGSLGETFWIRASGWLLWALVDSLENLAPNAEQYSYLAEKLALFAQGLGAHQAAGGAFHVLMNEADTPLETTGTAMIAYGLHKAVRLGWIDRGYCERAEQAWRYVESRILPDGNLTGCYSGWALPAEQRRMDFDRPMNWMPGLLLTSGSEMLRSVEGKV